MEKKTKGIIRVLIVEDSPSMCKALTNILNSDPQIIVAGVAYNGQEAVEVVSRLKPDIITMDIHMPVMDGFEATKQIMAYCPTPILILSTSLLKIGMDKVFEAISYGALDIFEKGHVGIATDKEAAQELIEKIKFLSNINVIHHPLARLEKDRTRKKIVVSSEEVLDRIIAIVASTGGPQALLGILKTFPANFPCGMVIVQHITSGFLEGLVEWLDNECQMKVKVAGDSEEIKAGVVYVAPCDLQMRVEEGKRISLSNEAPYNGHIPSGDVLLESVARVYKDGAIGVILTGMGSDGAIGAKAIKKMKGSTIAQDEKSCVVFGMPKAAIEMGVIDGILPLSKVADELMRLLMG